MEEIVALVKEKIIELIGNEFYLKYQAQIIFAIAVDEIECWFLPIYFSNDQKKSNKTSGCIKTLNTVLKQKEGFILHEKRFEYYEKIAKHFLKSKDLEKYAAKNESLSNFIIEFRRKTATE